ncbi:glycoside hydrolase family 6 protein [Streptacidiphilus rugosus]|uniref:glycoside hydrolase family 6 protein n=1 Tax=Streptacidiphilus rugosus TaxID=405783 RepID=UPI0022B4DC74|nr:glycoside hydrolase family 6 protein [Streptacidiphilus rugosus]
MRRLRVAAAAAALGAAWLVPVAAAQSAHAAVTHLANPFVGATPYLNPDYVAEVNSQASADGGTLGTAEAKVSGYQTSIWMDHIGAIAGDSTHRGLQAQLDNAVASGANLFEVVIYDLPGRDCAALASNGEIPATAAGLTEYESQYVDPIAAILGNSKYSNIRIAAIIEPDSLPNAVTNQSKAACQTATPYYETGVEYTLNKLHAIPNVYNYLDIGHSGWLGWSSNMGPAAQEFAKVAKATTAGISSVDGFVSDTANTTPLDEPFLPNSTLQVGGNPLDSAKFYQYNPYFDEHTYDEAMHASLVSAGFPSSVGMLIDTSRNGWGGSARPTALNSSPTTVDTYVAANKVDQRPFRGDWCNVNGAGIGARPTAQPYGSSDPIIAFIWVKPPGESDGDYPTATHSHGDPHCDPNGTQTDGNGGTYPTDAIPGYDVPAGQWFAAQFQQLVGNAYPTLGASSGGDTTPPSVPGGLKVTATTSSSVSLSWTASTDNVGVTAYNVYRGGTKVATVTSGTSYTDTGLSASTAYSYTVTAQDAAGNVSVASSAVSATTSASSGGDTTPPSVPGALTVTGTTSSSVSLSWTASTDNVGVTAYNVYRGGTKVAMVTSGTSYTDTGLSASTAYSYTVTAQDAAGNVSAASSAVSATTSASSGGSAGCTATYSISSDWGSGFNANVTITNTGSKPTTTWRVVWSFGGNQTVSNMWNATYTQSGSTVTAANMSYNNAIAVGGNTSFGFGATYSGTNAAPTLTCTAS